ncbi:ATP-binding cassette sub-family A member 17-like [Brevipalpus obovatus]|uniref:ATP-binding cassette sub-family A member 17-like n=1 Tax=Brevipalpus obovatus TaxID=246614 RepID=UPI003D9E1B69
MAMPYVESFNTSFQEPTKQGTVKLKAGVPSFYYSPSSSDVDKIIKFIKTNAKHSKVVSCADEPEVLKKMTEGNDSFNQGVIFNSLEPNLRFTIRSRNTLIASFFGIFEKSLDRQTNPFIRGLEYLWSEFIGLHWAITSTELVEKTDKVNNFLKYQPSYNVLTEDVKTRLSRWLLTSNMEMKIVVVAIIFGNLVALGSAAERAATEKRNGSRELLRIMGVSDCTYWVSQFITYLPLLIIQSILMSILIFMGLNQKTLDQTPFIGFILMLFSLFFSQLLLFFTIATFFYVPLVAEIANFGMFCAEALIVYFSPKYPFGTGSEVLRAFFFPPVLFFTWWKNVSTDPDALKPRLIAILLIPFWDFFAIVLFYVDAVCPWQKGYTKPWNFFLKRKKKNNARKKDMKQIKIEYESILVEDIPGEPIIACCDLYKTYSLFGSKKLAVENLSLKIIRNQITVLLGHNGAGKTTLLSMISGFTRTTYGQIFVNGYDVERDSIAARQTIALCPQEDCLYEDLTAKENLTLCANLRGVNIEIVSSTLKLLSLEDRSSVFASKLSGGMRRRLQLGMALATDCDTIILDEPTSGLDPEMRRTVWDHLISLRHEKTLFISTQSMEEADALADQIVIMSAGHIRCIGSPMFLKTKLAAGYSLTIEKDEFETDSTLKVIKKFYPKAVQICETSEEACYSLNAEESNPKKCENLSTLADLCDELDKKKKKLGISSYTIDTATIEDIFMKVAVTEGIVTEDRLTFSLVKDKTLADLHAVLNYSVRHKDFKHFSQGIRGLITKRYHYASRDYQSILIKYVIPLIIVLIGVSVVRIDTTYFAETISFPSRFISPDLYYSNFPELKIMFSGNNTSPLRQCFLRINYQHKPEIVETSLRIADYIKQTGMSRVSFDAEYLFGLQVLGSPQNVTIYENIKKYCLDGEEPSYFRLISPELWYMLFFGSFFFVIVIVITIYEHKISRFFIYIADKLAAVVKKPKKIGDKDVRREEKHVDKVIKNGDYEYEGLVAHKVTKDYFTWTLDRFRAVYDVSFTVHRKECFGLLGVNGAGKTTVFSMLTGEISMSSGQAYVDILHIYRDIARYRTDVSYCPQELALLDLLTPIETLTLFARLRGIVEKNVSKNVDFILSITDMEKCCRSLNCNLSGGNKRKLSLAIAVIGGPAVILLDEPTTGVDPASRRKIWTTLVGLRDATKISIILTSHSMTECEALCNRIAIMAKGQLACLGSPSHLKKKYGKGYTLVIVLKKKSDLSKLKESIKEVFSSAKLKDQHDTTVRYVLANPKLRWGEMYRSMRKLEEKYSIETFSIDNTSIEQVFLHFSNEDEDEDGDEDEEK